MYIRIRQVIILMCAFLFCIGATTSALADATVSYSEMAKLSDDVIVANMDASAATSTNDEISSENEMIYGIVLDAQGKLWYMPQAYPLTFLSQEEIDTIYKYNLYTIVDKIIPENRENRDIIWDYFYYKTGNAFGTAGLMGNMYLESGFNPKNVQGSFERKHGWTDDTYTAAADNGTYDNFGKDGAGYGLVQWTYWKYKQGLLDYAKSHQKSVGDIHLQLDYLYYQFTGPFDYVGNDIKSAPNIRFASDSVMLKFERPANQSEANRAKRATHGQNIYDECIQRCEVLDEIKTYIIQQSLNAEGRAKALEMQLQFNLLFNDIKTNVHAGDIETP